MTQSLDTKSLKQVGVCETCGDQAFSTRHDSALELWTDHDGNLHSKEVVRERFMCVYHKAKYIWHMDQKRKALEEKRKHGSKARTATQV
jgi:hypothetical protein